MRKLLWPLSIILAFGLGLYVMSGKWVPWSTKQSTETATTLVEQIEKVAKLATVEGHFSEIYDYKDYYGYDWAIFRKKALIRVQARVSAGYDLTLIEVEANPTKKQIILNKLPKPVILSIDHDLDYYDLTEGTFNTFTKDDLNKLNQQAKNYIEAAATKSDLLAQAEERGQEMLETMRFLVEGSGWTLIIHSMSIDAPLAN
jgi:hypothetical protein